MPERRSRTPLRGQPSIIGLVSSWREGSLVQLAVQSALAGCDHVLVVDAPVGAGGAWLGEPSDFSPFVTRRGVPSTQRLSLRQTDVPYPTDAAKRTAMLGTACRKWRREGSNDPLWGVWVDGDERLLWPEMLRHYIARGAHTRNPNFPLRLVESQGGAVSLCYGKVVRLDLIAEYVSSSYEVRLHGETITRAWGNDNQHWNWQQGGNVEGARPPLQGEPHLLHLSPLRPPGRAEERLHDAEAADLATRLPSGLVLP